MKKIEMKTTRARLWVALLIAVGIGGFTGSAWAQAEMKGLWQSEEVPNTLWVVQEVVVEGEDMLAIFWLDEVPKSATGCTEVPDVCRNRAFDWSVLVGPEVDGVWELWQSKQVGYQSTTKVGWKFTSDDTADMTLRNCDDDNCGDFEEGDVIAFKRVYGDDGGTPPPSGIKGGTWEGVTSDYEACFNVDPSGTKITTSGSSCQNGNSYNFELEEGTEPGGGDCNFDFYGRDPIQINNGKFSYSEKFEGIFWNETKTVTGIFEGGKAHGTLQKIDHKWGNHCEGTWEASPPFGPNTMSGDEALGDRPQLR